MIKTMKPIITTIGSATRDIFLMPQKNTVEYFKDKDNILSQEKICFELGAKLEADYLSSHVGGTAVNVSIGLSRLGIKSQIFSTVGNDSAGKAVIEKLQDEKVETNLLYISNNDTDRSLIIIHPKTNDRTIFVNKIARKGTNIDYSKINSKCIYLSSIKYDWQNNFKKIIKLIQQKKIRCFFTPGILQVKAGLSKLRNLLKLTEIMFLNYDEAIEITRSQKKELKFDKLKNTKIIAEKIKNKGPKIVVITDGANGVYLYRNKIKYYPVKKSPIIDVTGAGDAFASGFMATYLKKDSLDKAVKNGIKNSKSVIKNIGTTYGLLEKRQLTIL
ncbi:MAG: hypothetical protein GF347_01215 [Candidatus Moranbacteria bacterium]|nr:hypothetical protein [Candidatus Moranbacteria bacterium]